MAGKPQLSSKHLAIVKANAQNVAVVAIASFITVFCLMAGRTVYSQNQYLAKVTKAKETAHNQLVKNLTATSKLVSAYQGFVSQPNNVIGGSTDGNGDKDGDNAKIILDALPSQYDFPALTASLEKILDSLSIKGSPTGTDDQLSQQANAASNSPQPVAMPFALATTNVNYGQTQQLIARLQASIRPIQIDTLNLSGATNNMSLTLTAHTYFQPAKNLSIKTEVIKQ